MFKEGLALITKGENFKQTMDKRLTKMNQEITIRDLYMQTINYSDSFGESKTVSRPKTHETFSHIKVLDRLTDHIQYLAHITNEYHCAYYCDYYYEEDVFKTKKECTNKITRLLTPEFSFYTKEPLSLDDYHTLLKTVDTIANQRQENVHLLLSSFAVEEDDQLFNVSLYVQCGAQPKIDCIIKPVASTKDVTYAGTDLFNQRKKIYYQLADQHAKKYGTECRSETKNFIALNTENSPILSSQMNFSIETAGGAQYRQVIDICLTHYHHHAEHQVQHILSNTKQDTEFWPSQADHILTSNTIKPIETAQVVKELAHVDPVHSNPKALEADTVETEDLLSRELMNKYADLFIEKTENAIYIENPPFGESTKIVPTIERKLSSYTDAIAPLVTAYNERVLENLSQLHLSPTPLVPESSPEISHRL